MTQPTAQQVFDTVLTHLRAQDKPALQSPLIQGAKTTPECVYRSHEGLSCAVGCLIPDALYDPVIEGLSLDGIHLGGNAGKALGKILETLGLTPHLALLKSLQAAHDWTLAHHGPVEFEERMERIAETNGLVFTPFKDSVP